ncbi:MAG TPA: alpha/beta hydrolase [Thermoleophilaceae bacterium]|jgi:pimeloyl-ACP methyl ester carboxylesterase|nr:alpha/beta hydrolase [Thermoleophilaceae bacterium]
MNATREIELSAGTIQYQDTGGEGPAIVFVHGLLATGALWSMVVPPLAASARCIVPELPLGAHRVPLKPDADLSPRGVARLLAELLDELDLHDVTIVGNDTGGAISQLLVTEHPERIGKLVLTPSDCFEYFFPPQFKPLQVLSRVPGGLEFAIRSLRFKIVRNSPLGFGNVSKAGVPDELMRAAFEPYFTNPAIRRDVRKFVRAVSKEDTLAAAERLRDFDRPVLLAWAREDKFFPVKLAERLLERLPDGRLELIDDSYTFVPFDQPERLTELVRDFVLSGGRQEVAS